MCLSRGVIITYYRQTPYKNPEPHLTSLTKQSRHPSYARTALKKRSAILANNIQFMAFPVLSPGVFPTVYS